MMRQEATYSPHNCIQAAFLRIEKLVAKRKACLQPEKTHGYQYLFAVQFFNFYVYWGQVNKGHFGV